MPLQTVALATSLDKIKLVEGFSPLGQTWLVADLQSKLELQDQLLERHRAIPETAVMRISELWQRLARRHLPDWRIVSLDFVRTLFQSHMKQRGLSFARGPRAAQTMIQLMPQMLPLLIQTPDTNLVREWLKDHTESLLRWGHWFEAANELWDELSRRQIMPASWMAGLFLDLEVDWPLDFVIDLGVQWTALERRVIAGIQTPGESLLLRPVPKWGQVFSRALQIYEEGPTQREAPQMEDYRVKRKMELRHFTTQLAEAKDLVSQVRSWLDRGLLPSQIVVAAQDPEIYWPVLFRLLQDEGIPIQKDWLGHFHDRITIQRGLSRLRLALGDLSTVHLEAQIYVSEDSVSLPFSRFERLFTHLYGAEQLSWIPTLRERFGQRVSPEQRLTRDEWVVWLAENWPADDETDLEPLMKRLAQECTSDTVLALSLWVDLFETLAGKIEIVLEPAAAEGIRFVRFQAAEWISGTHLYVLGLNEEYLSEQSVNQLSHAEVQMLQQDLGVALPMSDRAQAEFEARWILDRPYEETVLAASDRTVTGQTLTLSRLFLVQSENPKQLLREVATPGKTRADEIQGLAPAAIAKIRNWSQSRAERLEQGLKQDLGLSPGQNFGAGWARRLSASLLERAAQCPFHWAAALAFRLEDMPAQDLELDRPSAGRLMHGIFEKLTEEPRRFNWSDDELCALIDDLGRRLEIYDFGLWPKFRRRHLDLARRFLSNERQWRDQFPLARTVARELKFKMKLDQSSKTWVKVGDGPELAGRIDRVDEGPEDLVIYDYKSSGASLRQPASWVGNSHYQLALYVQAVEGGATELPAQEVKAALYYNARTMDRDKGFRLKETSAILPDPGRGALSRDQSEDLWRELNSQIVELVSGLQKGELAPNPKDSSGCVDCAWRTLCRAAHLN